MYSKTSFILGCFNFYYFGLSVLFFSYSTEPLDNFVKILAFPFKDSLAMRENQKWIFFSFHFYLIFRAKKKHKSSPISMVFEQHVSFFVPLSTALTAAISGIYN